MILDHLLSNHWCSKMVNGGFCFKWYKKKFLDYLSNQPLVPEKGEVCLDGECCFQMSKLNKWSICCFRH